MGRTWAFLKLDWRTMSSMPGKIVFLLIWALCVVEWPAFYVNVRPGGNALPYYFVLGCAVVGYAYAGMAGLFTCVEKNKLETLDATLALTRGDVVKGHYLFMLCLAAGLFLTFLLVLVHLGRLETGLPLLAALFMLYASFVAVTYPCCFKWGYRTAMAVAYVYTFLVVGVPVMFSGALAGFVPRGPYFAPGTAFFVVPGAFVGMLAASGFALLYLSYLLSLRIYRRRDL